ncbi:MAG: recombinase family protein [Aeromicrobium erythreum]
MPYQSGCHRARARGQRQEVDCRKRAEPEGLEVTHVYTDNDTGASNLSKKKRPEYDAMLEAIRAGGIDVILAYSTSRLTRKNREFEDLIAQGAESQFDGWDEFMNATIYEQVATVRCHVSGVVIQPATSKAWNPARVDIYTQRGTEINGAHIKPMASSVVVAEPRKKNWAPV